MPWNRGHNTVWDATYSDIFATSSSTAAGRAAGEVALQAEERKREKYSSLGPSYTFLHFAVETSGVLGTEEAILFLKDLGRQFRDVTGDGNSYQYLLQGISGSKEEMPSPFWACPGSSQMPLTSLD